MSLTYDSYLTAMRNILVSSEAGTDESFEEMVTRMIEQAELRILRELDLLVARTTDTSVATVSGSRNITLPSTIVVAESLNIISPSGTTDPELGTRIPLQRYSIDFINAVYPVAATTGVPSAWAMLSQTAVKLAPTPNGAFTVEIVGTIRPTPLSPDNTSTFISTYLPDLFIAASASWAFGAIRQNYGAQSDDPKSAMSWEQAYQTAKASAATEEARKRVHG